MTCIHKIDKKKIQNKRKANRYLSKFHDQGMSAIKNKKERKKQETKLTAITGTEEAKNKEQMEKSENQMKS